MGKSELRSGVGFSLGFGRQRRKLRRLLRWQRSGDGKIRRKERRSRGNRGAASEFASREAVIGHEEEATETGAGGQPSREVSIDQGGGGTTDGVARNLLDEEKVYGVYVHSTSKMFLTIDTEDSRPIYQQVVDGIKELIARGKLAEGAKLPPVRQLAADLGVNLNTIATAYRELQKDGLIVIRHGSGSVVTSRKLKDRSEDELLRPLSTALTELVLAGLSPSRILNMVIRELNTVEKGSK